MLRLYLLLSLCLCLYSCRDRIQWTSGTVSGFVPIYSKDDLSREVTAESARNTVKGGKIYTYGNYLFQNEIDSGVHIINYEDKQHPQKTAFISIPGCTEVAVEDHFLYANNYNDLVVIDLLQLPTVKITSRVPNAFPATSQMYPPENGYFECVDPAKGIVTGWKREKLTNPKCQR
jgi:hypothetical protein